jgi:uncharacterized protein YdbL (DUF1318 family)
MMKQIRRVVMVVALGLIGMVGVAGSAHALTLEQAKEQGVVGEQLNGLLGTVGTASPEVQTLVSDVNSRRLKLFNEIAKDKGQPLAAVQAVSGQEFIGKTAKGHYVQNASGAWVKK